MLVKTFEAPLRDAGPRRFAARYGRTAMLLLRCCAGILTIAALAAFTPTDRITKNGLGDIKIGMTIAQVGKEVGRTLDVQYLHDESCGNAVLGKDISAIFAHGRLARIYVGTPRYKTRKGIHVGHHERDVYARYGRSVKAVPHHYVQGGFYLRVTTRRRRVVFETDASGRVDQISVGRIPEVDYVESCA